jgi:hypothetical protein
MTATCRRNLVPTFVDTWVSRGERGGSPTAVNVSFLDRSRYFSSSSSFILTRAECTPFQTHCYSGNLVAPGIELGTSGLAARNSDHQFKITVSILEIWENYLVPVIYPSPEILNIRKHKKQTPWPLARKRTIPTERPPLVDEI